MKMVILLLLLAIGAVAEDWPAACGPKKREIRSDEKFDLKVDKSVTEAPVPADQAAVYFVSKTANSEAPPKVSCRLKISLRSLRFSSSSNWKRVRPSGEKLPHSRDATDR